MKVNFRREKIKYIQRKWHGQRRHIRIIVSVSVGVLFRGGTDYLRPVGQKPECIPLRLVTPRDASRLCAALGTVCTGTFHVTQATLLLQVDRYLRPIPEAKRETIYSRIYCIPHRKLYSAVMGHPCLWSCRCHLPAFTSPSMDVSEATEFFRAASSLAPSGGNRFQLPILLNIEPLML